MWGNPGVGLAGMTGIAGSWQLIVTGANGHVYDYTWDSTALTWNWRDFGGTGVALGSAGSPPIGSGAARIATARDSATAYYGVRGLTSTVWAPLNTPEPAGALLGTGPAGLWVASAASGKLFRGNPGGTWETFGPPPGIDGAGLMLTGSLRSGQPVVAARGRTFELRSDGSWRDYGPPAPPGKGDPGAPPPAHRRWRARAGLLAANGGAPGRERVAHPPLRPQPRP